MPPDEAATSPIPCQNEISRCHCFMHSMWNFVTAPLHPKSFAITTTCFTVMLLCCVATINWLVNPYSQYSSNLLAPLVRDSRSEKVALFEQQQQPSEGLILGSSRTMKFEPKYLQHRTNLRFFNFGVNHGRPEDFLAIVLLYKNSFGQFPKSVLIGVDVAALSDTVPSDARLNAEPKLYSQVRYDLPWTDEFDRLTQLLSYQQFASSIKSIQKVLTSNSLKITSKATEAFDADGVIQYLQRESERLAGSYDFDKAIQYNELEFLTVFRGMTSLSKTRIKYLQKAVAQCEQNGCQVTLFLTVHHPILRETLSNKTAFVRLEQNAKEALQNLADESQARFVDLSTIDTFGGDPKEFVDGVHPLEPNTRRMIDRLFPQSTKEQYAIQ